MNPAPTSGPTSEPVILDAAALTSDPELEARFAESSHRILADLVSGGAALGWVAPPSREEVAELLDHVITATQAGDAALRAAYVGRRLVGLGYWLRYARPTHRPHADWRRSPSTPLPTAVASDGR